MPEVNTGDRVDDVFGDVPGMIANAFDGRRDPEHVERLAERARILNHRGEQLPPDGFEGGLDSLLGLDHLAGSVDFMRLTEALIVMLSVRLALAGVAAEGGV